MHETLMLLHCYSYRLKGFATELAYGMTLIVSDLTDSIEDFRISCTAAELAKEIMLDFIIRWV